MLDSTKQIFIRGNRIELTDQVKSDCTIKEVKDKIRITFKDNTQIEFFGRKEIKDGKEYIQILELVQK